jgi:hypothetical protein
VQTLVIKKRDTQITILKILITNNQQPIKLNFMTQEQTFYIVKYNDTYGNGDETSIEALLKSEKDFKKWLKEHNKERRENGEDRELAEEFDVIPVQLFN